MDDHSLIAIRPSLISALCAALMASSTLRAQMIAPGSIGDARAKQRVAVTVAQTPVPPGADSATREARYKKDSVARAAKGDSISGKCWSADCTSLFPADNADQAKLLWGEATFSALDGAALTGSDKVGSAYVDIGHDFFGPARVSVRGTVATSSNSTDTAKARETFFTGGGNASARLDLMLPSVIKGANYIFLLAAPRVGFTIPALGGSTKSGNENFDLGVEAQANVAGKLDQLGLSAGLRLGSGLGPKSFYNQLGTPGAFAYLRSSIGLRILHNWVVVFNKTIAGPKALRTNDGTFSLGLSKQASTTSAAPASR